MERESEKRRREKNMEGEIKTREDEKEEKGSKEEVGGRGNMKGKEEEEI